MENIMNKNNRRTLPMVMAMLVMVTAMCAVGSAQGELVVTKDVVSGLDGAGYAYYNIDTGIGSNIVYDILVKNVDTSPTEVTSVVDWIPYPQGTTTNLDPFAYILPVDETQAYTTYYAVNQADLVLVKGAALEVDDEIVITNHVMVCYLYDCECEWCEFPVKVIENPTPTPTPTYSTPPTDVPAQSPIAIVALIGLLGLIGAGMIIGRR